jgi:hypothetical protein
MNLFSRSALIRLIFMGTLTVCLSACTRVVPVRTLPSWVRGIYIPMIKNKSFEPGLEEIATKAVQGAFIQDGRVDIVPEKDADLVLLVTIDNWQGRSARHSNDNISTHEDVRMTADLKLFEPLDMEKPLADLGKVLVRGVFNQDVRSIDFVPEPDRRAQLMSQLGSQVLNQVILGFPIQLRNAPAGALRRRGRCCHLRKIRTKSNTTDHWNRVSGLTRNDALARVRSFQERRRRPNCT